jgi:hypothetical protein
MATELDPTLVGLKCVICGKQAIGVASSFVPISHAWCAECLFKGLYPYNDCVVACCGLTKDTVDPDFIQYIRPSLEHAGKTVDDLFKDAAELERGFCEHEDHE